MTFRQELNKPIHLEDMQLRQLEEEIATYTTLAENFKYYPVQLKVTREKLDQLNELYKIRKLTNLITGAKP